MTLNGSHTKTYPNGGTYEGEFRGGKMDGMGIYMCPNGDRLRAAPAIVCACAEPRQVARRACDCVRMR